MAVRLRMRRMGSKKRPFYRLVAADTRYQRDGRFLEILGYYDPMVKPFKLVVDREKILKWLENGAMLSNTAETLLRKQGIIQEFNMAKSSTKPLTGAETAALSGAAEQSQGAAGGPETA